MSPNAEYQEEKNDYSKGTCNPFQALDRQGDRDIRLDLGRYDLGRLRHGRGYPFRVNRPMKLSNLWVVNASKIGKAHIGNLKCDVLSNFFLIRALQ